MSSLTKNFIHNRQYGLVDSESSSEILFQEWEREYVFGSEVPDRKHNLRVRRDMRLSFIVTVVLFFICVFVWNFLDKDLPFVMLSVALPVFALIFLYLSEVVSRKYDLSAHTIIMYSNGIQMHASHWESIIGFKGFVPREDVNKVEIRRYEVFDKLSWDGTGKGLKYIGAPVEFVLCTKNGRRHRSGPKPPELVVGIINLMKERWGIEIHDEGQGNGKVVEYNNWKPSEDNHQTT
jgi:hypothetical protein